MGWVEEKVEQITNIIDDVVSGVVEGVIEPIVEKVIEPIIEIVVDDIIAPIAESVTDIVDAALSDPIGTIAKVYAVSTGQLYLLPYISAATTAINGGSLTDVVKAAAVSMVAQAVGAEVSAFAGTAGTAAELGVNVGSEQATALALQEAGMGSLVSVTNAIAASSISSAAVSLVTGQDPIAALATGGIGAAVPAALGQIEGFQELQRSSPAVANVIKAAITTELQNGDVGSSAINSLIVSSGIAAKAINQFDPDKKLTDAERAVATNLIINTTRAAVKGQDVNAAINQTLLSSAINTLGTTITKEFKDKVAVASTNYNAATVISTNVADNENKQNEVISNYNNIATQIDIRVEEQSRLQAIDAANREKYEQLRNAGASTSALNAQAAVIAASTNEVKSYAESLSQFVNETKPQLDAAKAELAALRSNEGNLQTQLTDVLQKQVDVSKPVSDVVDVATDKLNESFTKILAPEFNAKEYVGVNGLDANVNPYTDFMQKGRDAGAPINLEAARAEVGKERTRLVNEVLAAKGMTLDTADPATVSKLLDSLDSTYGSNLGELRGASIQDVISGNTRTVEELVADSKKPFRVEIAGNGYGEWNKPNESAFKVPAGYRLASVEEFENRQAQGLLASDGNSVFLMPEGTPSRVVWNADAGAYEPQSIPVLGLPPSTAEVFSYAAKKDPENAGLFTNIAAVAATGFGQQIETWSNAMSLQFGGDMKNTASNFGKSLQEWGAANTPAEVIEQMKSVEKGMKEATGKGSVWDQTVAVTKLAKENPNAFINYIGSEVVQEALPIGAGLAAAGVAAYLGAPLLAGLAVGTGISTIIDGIEVFGSTGKDVYDGRIKAGDSEADARSKATIAGYKAALVTAPANAVSNAAIFIPYLKTLGTVANTALQGVKAVSASAASEYIETYGQSLITQAAINPNAPLDFSDAHVKSVFSAMIGAGTSSVILTPSMVDGSLVIGFDNSGNEVTYSDLQRDPTRVNLSNINTSVVVGKSESGGNVTLGDLLISPDATDTANNIVTSTGDNALPVQVEQVIDPLITDEGEARATFEALGYSPTQEDINAYIGKVPEAVSLKSLESKYDPLATTVTEAQQIAKDFGYENLTNDEALTLAGQIKESDALKNIETYVQTHSVNADTAKDLLITAGILNPTPEQISRFTTAGPTVDSALVKSELVAYADPISVIREEVIDAYARLGLKKPAEADIQKLIGVYAEAELAGKAGIDLDKAIENSQVEQIEKLTEQIGTQRRDPTQGDLDTLQKMVNGVIPADPRYDIDQDGQITTSDINFLKNIITRPNVQEPFAPGPGSIWSPTGLYGKLEETDRLREQDRIRLEEQRARDVEEQRRAAAAESQRSKTQAVGGAAAQALQRFTGTAPTLVQQATQETATPIYGQAIKEFDFGAPLDVSFFEPSKEKQGSQIGQQTTKIATGGYLEDLLAENMTADDLLKLLR